MDNLKSTLPAFLQSKKFKALALYFFITTALLWPLPKAFSTHIIGAGYGDNLEYVWKLWWVQHSLFDLGISPLTLPHIYYPYGYSLAMSAITPLHTYFGAPLTYLVGPVAAYNTFVFLSFVLAGWFAYLYVERLLQNSTAAFISGLIFAFLPYHFSKIQGGNFNVVAIQWIPLFFYFLDRYLEDCKRREAVHLALAFAACTLSSWYYGIMTAALAPLYYIARQRAQGRPLAARQQWKDGLAFLGLSSVLIFPFLVPYLKLMAGGDSVVPLDNVVFWAASFTDYLTPSQLNGLWGRWVIDKLSPFPELNFEFVITWGFAASLLAVYGWKMIPESQRKGWGALMAAAFVLSLGPAFKVFHWAPTLPAAGTIWSPLAKALDWLGVHSLAREVFSLEGGQRIWIPLPALLLRWFVPGFTGLRSWGRFSVFAALAAAVLAGGGVKRILGIELERKGNAGGVKRMARKNWAAFLIVLLLGFELNSGIQQLVPAEGRAVDVWLAARPEKVVILEMPLQIALSGQAMFYSRYHEQNVASGYGTYFPFIFKEKYPALADFPSDASLDVLRNWGADVLGAGAGIDYILVNGLNLPPGDPIWQALANQKGLELVEVIEGVHVYQIAE
ncbi:MAG: hypothetical protein OEY93_01380 [Anaerolineae bacterium]|nr:hypothetical protein [Anaerolineae bacterium]